MKIETKNEQAQEIHYSDHHILSLSYPDLSISVPLNETVELTAPAMVEHRSPPPRDSRDMAIYETDFALALPLEKRNCDAKQYPSEYRRLFAAVEALKAGAGATKMGILRLHQEIWDEKVFRVRLETHWVGPSPKMPPQDFELSGADWEALVSFAKQRTWIEIMKHLVERASAKAYYHVRQRIVAECGSQVADQEESSWSETWGTKLDKIASELFLARLKPLYQNIQHGEMPHFLLECGHAYHRDSHETLRIEGIRAFGEVCKECETLIMKRDDDEYLDAVEERSRTWQFAKIQRVWASLVKDEKGPEKPKRFHAMTIFRILGAALDSLRSPAWVAPKSICPTTFEETSLVLEHLKSMFWGSNKSYEQSAGELLENLEYEALGVRVDDVPLGERVNPPGWDDFVARWLRRTAYFLAYRRCQRGTWECKGLHGHRDGLWYSAEVWEREEAECHEKEVSPFDTGELMKALEAISL